MTVPATLTAPGGQPVTGDLVRRREPAAGPADLLPAEQVLALLPAHPAFPTEVWKGREQLRGAAVVLRWLEGHPGSGWQQRWHNAGADAGLGWVDGFVADDPRSRALKRAEVTAGLRSLLLNGLVRPSYEFFGRYKPATLIAGACQMICG